MAYNKIFLIYFYVLDRSHHFRVWSHSLVKRGNTDHIFFPLFTNNDDNSVFARAHRGVGSMQTRSDLFSGSHGYGAHVFGSRKVFESKMRARTDGVTSTSQEQARVVNTKEQEKEEDALSVLKDEMGFFPKKLFHLPGFGGNRYKHGTLVEDSRGRSLKIWFPAMPTASPAFEELAKMEKLSPLNVFLLVSPKITHRIIEKREDICLHRSGDKDQNWYYMFLTPEGVFEEIDPTILRGLLPRVRIDTLPNDNRRKTDAGIIVPFLPPEEFKNRNTSLGKRHKEKSAVQQNLCNHSDTATKKNTPIIAVEMTMGSQKGKGKEEEEKEEEETPNGIAQNTSTPKARIFIELDSADEDEMHASESSADESEFDASSNSEDEKGIDLVDSNSDSDFSAGGGGEGEEEKEKHKAKNRAH